MKGQLQKKQLSTVLEAIEELRGCKARVAKSLGVSRATVYLWIQNHPEIAQAFEDIKEERLDIGESALDAAVERGEAWAVCFLLKTQGKDRGYIERQELSGKDGAPIAPPVLNVIIDNGNSDSDK
jgi:predicted transcriptional regulator